MCLSFYLAMSKGDHSGGSHFSASFHFHVFIVAFMLLTGML